MKNNKQNMIIKMNFGDILEKWERSASQSYDSYQPYIKDTPLNKKPGENRKYLLRTEPDDILDIHGLTGEKAWISLDYFFTSAKNRSLKKLRIIHGKGNRSAGDAVLVKIVRKFIEKCPFAGKSSFEKAKNGGTGATWVLLK